MRPRSRPNSRSGRDCSPRNCRETKRERHAGKWGGQKKKKKEKTTPPRRAAPPARPRHATPAPPAPRPRRRVAVCAPRRVVVFGVLLTCHFACCSFSCLLFLSRPPPLSCV